MITLYGKIKEEFNDRCHLMFCVNKTSNGIHVGGSIKMDLLLQRKKGRKKGPLITDISGKMIKVNYVNDMFRGILCEIWDQKDKQDMF